MRRISVVLVWLLTLLTIEPLIAAEPDAKIQLHVGDTLESALVGLNSKGYHIIYSSALVLPSMTLRSVPKSSNINDVLQELLSPFHLHAVHTANDEWLVTADATAASVSPASLIVARTATEDSASLDTIVVTGSRFGLAIDGASKSFLDRADVEHMPHLADDAMRMLKVLPGVSGGDFSAALNVRGGRRDETMVMIDGAEIHNATHFRDLDGAFSVLDTNLVQSINFITGGQTVEYSDYMSGVVDMRTRRPREDDEYRNTAGISFVSAYASRGDTFSDGKGSWLVSTRRGFLDLLANLAENNGNQLVPRYTDVFGSMRYDFSGRTSVATHILFSDDNLKFVSDDDTGRTDSAGRGQSLHTWVTVDHAWTDNLHMDTVMAAATLKLTRDSQGADNKRSGNVRSNDHFQFLDFHQDWSWKGSDHFLPRWGFNLNRQQADYDYALREKVFDPYITDVPIDIAYGTHLKVSGYKYGAYASLRTRIGQSLTAEAGARWDSYRYPQPPGSSVPRLEFNVVSPRLNVVYQLGQRNAIHAAWGVMYQPQGIDELQVEDNVTQFFRPERSRQITLGYSREFSHELSLRFDIYNKQYSDLRPRYENGFDPVQLIPEGAIDRIRIDAPEARARGVELTLRHAASMGFSGWMSVSLAKAEDKEDGMWVPRTWEQRTTFSFGSSWSDIKWNISLAGTYHTGTPTTYLGASEVQTSGGTTLKSVIGPRNGERLGAYSRLDIRASRIVPVRRGKFSYYLEVTNLLDSKNECCVEDFGFKQDGGGNRYFFEKRSDWLPILPSAGVQYEF